MRGMEQPANDIRVVAESDRLRMRRFVDADAAFYQEMLADPDFKTNIGDRGIDNLETALENMRNRVYTSYEVHGFGMYLAERKSDGVAVGMAGLVKRDFLKNVDVGYAFLPVGRGQGFATEAAAAMIDHARNDFGLKRLAAITALNNIPSIRVLERLGFRDAGTLQFPDDGEFCAHFLLDL